MGLEFSNLASCPSKAHWSFCRTNVGVGLLPKELDFKVSIMVFLLIQHFLHFLDVLPLCLTPYC